MESDIVYTTAEERSNLNLILHRFLIMGNFSKETGLQWCSVTGLYRIVDKKQWLFTKLKYGI